MKELTPQENEVRLEWMRPRQIDAAMEKCPTLYQPLGTIEWHGLHNVTGLDAVKAHMLCIRAAQRGGGLVAPPLFGGMGGLDQPHTFVIESEEWFESYIVRSWFERICCEAVRQGYRTIIFLTGHYGAAQQIILREVAVRMTRMLGVPILGNPEYFLALDVGYIGDHAGFGETSLMLYMAPESVDVSELGEPPFQGVGGGDPRDSTKEDGERMAERIIENLTDLAQQMPQWDADTISAFANAEAAIINKQLELSAQENDIWAGWRNIGAGAMKEYASLLVTRQFDKIAALADTL